jgi:hypothetical protein
LPDSLSWMFPLDARAERGQAATCFRRRVPWQVACPSRCARARAREGCLDVVLARWPCFASAASQRFRLMMW